MGHFLRVLPEEKPEMLKQDFIASLQVLFFLHLSVHVSSVVFFPRLFVVYKIYLAGTTAY